MKKSLLERILDPQELSVRFQPIFRVNGNDRSVDSLEALIRGPQGTNFESAEIMLDYARRKRAEAEIDRSCIKAICKVAMNLPTAFRINVNVHASTLGQDPGFVDFFHTQLKKYSLGPWRFVVEIIEHAPACNIPALLYNLNCFRDAGIRIALDDVGLGHSNYRMILDCNPDYFKIDAYFVRGVSADTKRRAVIESIVALSRSMGAQVVAEGPETKEELRVLQETGVELVQSNLLCEAMPLFGLQATGLLDISNAAAAPRDQRQNPAPMCEQFATNEPLFAAVRA